MAEELALEECVGEGGPVHRDEGRAALAFAADLYTLLSLGDLVMPPPNKPLKLAAADLRRGAFCTYVPDPRYPTEWAG